MQNYIRYHLLLISIAYSFITSAQSINSFTLINASTDTEIGTITEGLVYNIDDTGIQLNIRANVTGTVGSVKFELNGQAKNTESTAPYAMTGDNNGDYNIWSPSIGEQTLIGTAYTAANGGGTVIGTLEINFSFTETIEPIDPPTETGTGEITISGEMKKWHKITLDFDGPNYNENDNSPNPYLDFRLNVTFTNGSLKYTVPGYFAADGNAGETGANNGNVWRVHFSPDQIGTWTYTTSFRIGQAIAVSDDPSVGDAITSIDGKTGTFEISASDKTAPDLRSKGRLQYVNKHHLQFAETGEYFIKGGADAPENFLAYQDFDGEFKTDGIKDNLIKTWEPHISDWNTGDPIWHTNKGKGIIGAVNYLAESGLNVFSFLTMNVGGDDANVYPYLNSSDHKHFDNSKLDQWEIVFSHGQKMGMYLHFKTQETENDQLLDGGNLGQTRKLYYRELIARFGHHLALNWNLGEENTQTIQQRKDMAQYFYDHDPYHHHVVIHSYPDQQDLVYPSLLGNASKLTGASIQTNWNKVYADTKRWIEKSVQAGTPWVVANDEQGSANIGVPDDAYDGTPDLDQIRYQVLWGNLMAGGAGVEYYFGYQRPNSDLSAQDYRSRSISWGYVSHALKFFREHVPFQKMKAMDNLTQNGWCLTDEENTYVVYLPDGESTTIDLTGVANIFDLKWFDPKNGGELQNGSQTFVAGNGVVSLGGPPNTSEQDWVVLLTKGDISNIDIPLPSISASTMKGPAPLTVSFDGTGSMDNGSIVSYEWTFSNGEIKTGEKVSHTFNDLGENVVSLKVTDDENKTASTQISILVKEDAPSSDCGNEENWLSAEMDISNSSFYVDNFTGTPLLAITPNEATGEAVTASVTQTFSGETCTYDVIFHGVGESDGQAKFKVFLNNELLGSEITLPLSTDDWEIGELYNTVFEGITLTNGDILKVEGSTASADGQEWSRARWLKLQISPQVCTGGALTETEGYIVVEAENTTLNDHWILTNSFSVDALGEGHIEYTGANSYGSVPENSILTYDIKINTPGTYQFKWRSRNGKTAVKFDEENDSWIKIDADEFYGLKGGVKTNSTNHFMKMWIQDLNNWSWNSFGEHAGVNSMNVFARFDKAGTYTVSIAGRSHNHPIDRFVLFQDGKGTIAMNNDTPASGGGCTGSSKKTYATPKEYGMKSLEQPIEIDGTIDTVWEYVSTDSGAFESSGLELPSAEDLSFDFKMAYDDNNIYCLIEVEDDQYKVFPGSGNEGDYDGVEFYFNADNKHNNDGIFGENDHMIRFNYGNTENHYSGAGTWHSDFENFKYVTKKTDTGYLIEAQLPWTGLLKSGELSTNDIFGFDIAVLDADGENRLSNHISWANNTTNQTGNIDTRKYGSARLNAPTPNYPNRSNWEVIYVDSEDGPGNRDLAIDGDLNTFWHTEWQDAQPTLPHEIQIDMKKEYAINEVHYYHRQDQWGPNGAIGDYEIFISNSPNNWGEPAAKGSLDWPSDFASNYKMLHTIGLSQTHVGRYLKLVALSEAQNNPEIPFTAIAELLVITDPNVDNSIPLSVDRQDLFQFSIRPNPVNTTFTVSGLPAQSKIEIITMSGKRVSKSLWRRGHGQIEVENLKSGVYILNIIYAEGSKTLKFIKK
ncbi:MAG: DUF5060 domain-containing protein [Reichenbachiella sp.]